MANTHVFETKMSDRMQVTRYSTGVYSAQASFEERAKLKNGQAVTRPYLSRMYESSYTRGTAISFPDQTETNETLTVNTTPVVPFQLEGLDEIQSNFNLMEKYSKDAMAALNKAIDADYLAETASASSYVDAGDVGGTAGEGISIDSSNILKAFAAAKRKLMLKNVEITGMSDKRPEVGNMKPMGGAGFANLVPYFSEQLSLSLAGRETVEGDQVGKNGYLSKYFGFDCYDTTNAYWTGVLSMVTQPTDGDTVVVNGVTFTFKTTLGSTAGNVLIGGSADVARANLAALINTPGTTTANGVALSTANQNALKRMTATNDNSADTLTLTAKGYGHVVVSETFTDATDTWTATKQVSHQLFGQKGAVDMVLQKAPSVEVSAIPDRIDAHYVKPHVLYGKKTFLEGADALVDVRVRSSAWV